MANAQIKSDINIRFGIISLFLKSAAAASVLAAAVIPAASAQVTSQSATSRQPVPNQPDSVRFNPRDNAANPVNPPILPDSQLVAPSAPNWTIPPNPVTQFNKYILPAPPTNTSSQTRAELQELNGLAATRQDPNVIQTVTRWNFDVPASNYNLYFDYLAQKNQYSPPLAQRCAAILNQAIYSGILAAWYNKYTYLRPRPDQVTGYKFQADNPLLPTPFHPSYPSGHATSAGVFMAVGPSCYPNEPVESFVALGREASLARRQGGVHYYSDSVAGEALGYSIGSAVVRGYSQDGSPLGGNTAQAVYSRPPSFNSNGTPTTILTVRPATVTQGPQTVADQNDPLNPGQDERIILVPIQQNGQFSAPPAVQNPPAPLFNIPAASTYELGNPASTPTNPTGTTRNAPANFSDPNPAPSTSGKVNPSVQLAPDVAAP